MIAPSLLSLAALAVVRGALANPTPASSCDWAGHCQGAPCTTSDDCGDPFSCVNGICGGSSATPTPTPTPSATCSWAGHCQGATCSSDDDCADPFSCVNGTCGGSSSSGGSGGSTGGSGGSGGSTGGSAGNCFPLGSATFPGGYKAPSTSLADWWCPQSDFYGFMGFSYPLEVSDCSDPSNSYAAMNADFAQMKRDFGASIVRMYYPLCLSSSVFINAIKAAYDNNMGLIVQVWTNFGGGTVWQQSQQAIYNALNDPSVSAIAPYVVHWGEWGSEPVGDGMDQGNFVNDLAKFRATLNAKGIQAGISDDWDRPGTLSGSNGQGLTTLGSGIVANSDFAHIHPMPFYHFNDPESEAWSYIQTEIEWVKSTLKLPTFVTETQWAWGPTAHYNGHVDLGVTQYNNYWKTFDSNCAFFKAQNVGWFLHAWRGEDTFDIINPNGGYEIQNWRPQKC
ncbi:hypothetical protein V8C35DRAFT_34493 [Trichoderma chlorosporum]